MQVPGIIYLKKTSCNSNCASFGNLNSKEYFKKQLVIQKFKICWVRSNSKEIHCTYSKENSSLVKNQRKPHSNSWIFHCTNTMYHISHDLIGKMGIIDMHDDEILVC